MLTIARAMAASAPRDGVDPAAVIEARFDALATRAAQADPKPLPEDLLVLQLWGQGR